MSPQVKSLLLATILAVFAGSTLAAPALAAAPSQGSRHFAVPAKTDPGKYPSDNQECVAEVTEADIGGFQVLTVTRNMNPELSVNGVNGVAWLPGNVLAYSISGLFGDPGIYVFNCIKGHAKILVGKGEYFQLLGASSGKDATLYFFYSGDVARRHGGAIYKVKVDGSGLAKTDR